MFSIPDCGSSPSPSAQCREASLAILGDFPGEGSQRKRCERRALGMGRMASAIHIWLALVVHLG